jgi:hypothetical protein
LGDFFFHRFDWSAAAIEAAISIASNIEGDFDGRAPERRGDVYGSGERDWVKDSDKAEVRSSRNTGDGCCWSMRLSAAS